MTAARIRAWFPESAYFAIWSSSAFLFYLGAFVILFSIIWLLESLNGAGSDSGLVGWTTLALASVVCAALLLRRAGWTILAGLAAFIGVIVFAAWVGSIFDWAGFSPDESDNFFTTDFEPSLLVLEALVVAAALWAIWIFRFPLLVLPVAVIAWYSLVDNVALLTGDPGNDAHAAFAVIVGMLLVVGGIWLDRAGRDPYAFWLHVVGSLTVGGGILELLGNKDLVGDTDWAFVFGGLISLAYIAAARVLSRSNYAVIGAIGVLAVGTYFIQTWYSFISIPFLFEGSGGDDAKWKAALSYMVLGLVLVVLGVLVERGTRLRRRAVSSASP
ncbi:MAG: hypothetical protein AABM30_00150 [Actinomycetota bacterium]